MAIGVTDGALASTIQASPPDVSKFSHYTLPPMEVLIPIIAILMVFGAPTYIVKRVLDLKEKRLELEGGAQKELEAIREENKLLAARVEAMEETVLHGDFELNQKLKQIAITETKAPGLASQEKKKLGAGDGSE
jgi:hypothetical protein